MIANQCKASIIYETIMIRARLSHWMELAIACKKMESLQPVPISTICSIPAESATVKGSQEKRIILYCK